jgi:hypothetical protein
MAQAFVMTTTELWVGDRRALWVVLADTAELALETARTDGCDVDRVVGTLSEENSCAPWPLPASLARRSRPRGYVVRKRD